MKSKKIFKKRRNPIQKCKHTDDAVIDLIKGLDALIQKAKSKKLAVPVNMLHTTKEDLVYWASDLDFHESKQDRFIYKHLYEGDC